MNAPLLPLGRLAGSIGFLLCFVAGLARLAGTHWFAGFEVVTVLQIGIGGMVFGCFCLLVALTGASRQDAP
ncbi:MAG TPA: hypothetical protein VK165_00115 [Azonexus sp.]|nr:hypothetical protein [Azonexus sp.]